MNIKHIYWNKNIILEAPLEIDWFDELSIYKSITAFDIGVSPLIDDEFNRGKSAFKLKQCLSCGVPVLASGVGENKTFLHNGINSFLCDNADDFFKKIITIKSLHENTYLEMSENAKKSYFDFSIDNYCSILIDFFKQTYNMTERISCTKVSQ